MEETARTINKGFVTCINDRSPDIMQSKKWGTIHLCNLLFKIYFYLDQLNLCTNLIKAMGNGRILPATHRFPASERCCYGYYSGRFYLILRGLRKKMMP